MAIANTNAAAAILTIAAIIAAAAAASCDDEISSLTPCYSYIEGGDSTRPAADCCSRLGDTAASKPECLCRILNADNHLNKTRIRALPKACNVTTPPVRLCNSITISAGYSTMTSNSLHFTLIVASYASILTINRFSI